MKTSLNPSWLRDLVIRCGFLDAYAKANPYSPEFSKELIFHLDQAGRNLWDQLRAEFGVEPDETILRNTWAVASAAPILAGAVWRAANLQHSFDDALRGELRKLKSALLNRGNFADWLTPLIEPAFDSTLDLSGVAEFTPALRFRYELAALTKERFDSLECIKSIRKEKRFSIWARQREIRKALDAARAKFLEIQPIQQKAFLQLPLMSQHIIATDHHLISAMIEIDSDEPGDLAKTVMESWEARRKLRETLLELLRGSSSWNRKLSSRGSVRPLQEGDVKFFNEHARPLNLDAVDDDLCSELGGRFRKWLNLPRDPSSKWVPLSEKSVKLIRKVSPKEKIQNYLSLEAAEITRRLVSGKLSRRSITTNDLQLIQKTWTKRDRDELARTGRVLVLDQLSLNVAETIFPEIVKAADLPTPSIAKEILAKLVRQGSCISEAIPILERDKCRQLRQRIREAINNGSEAWAKAIFPFFGTEAAAGIFVNPSKRTAENLLVYLSVSSDIKDYDRYKDALAHAIGTSLKRAEKNKLGQWINLAGKFVINEPGSGESLVDCLGSKAVVALLKQCSADSTLRKALESTFSDAAALKKINQYRIAHVGSASELFNIVRANPTLIERLRPGLAENLALGTSNNGRAALVLCFRRSPERLKKLAQAIGTERFRGSVALVCKLLPERSRDRGYLELAATLGSRNIRILAAVMASMERSAPPGHKLDKSYHHYKLPKKSGGSRTVSVPNPILKKAQKAILLRILDGVEAHPAAHGFVKGRSIGSNAALHVDCPVVSNCDIANCFPSVKWSLVLGALRRDFRKTLSPAAISLLVDICTMQGGLPIGAPTSPALLNHVLLKTDQMLSAAASKRQCNYSRYADDMTFSGDGRAVALLGVAKRTLAQIGLSLDSKKTNIYRRGRRQIVTGLVVNDRVSVPRRLRRRMRAAVHAVEQGKAPTWHGQEESVTALRGRVAYLRSVNREEGERLISRLKSIGDESDD